MMIDRVHHRADGDGDAAERHDVRADALPEHDEERNQHRDRQNDDGHQRAAQMEQERRGRRARRRGFPPAAFPRASPTARSISARAVVGHGDLHVRRQRLHRLVQPLLHVLDDLAGIRAVAHHDDAADGFAVAVQLGDAAAHVGAELDVGHVAQQDRHAVGADADGDFLQVVQASM